MSFQSTIEYGVAQLCQSIWSIPYKSYVCGLLEEAVEVARSTKTITKDELLQAVKYYADHAYATEASQEPASVDLATLHQKLVNLQTMMCCVRGHTSYNKNESLLECALSEVTQSIGNRALRPPPTEAI